MIETQEQTRAYLERRFPGRWLRACNDAWQLACKLEYVNWHDRSRLLDTHLWNQAKTRLGTDEVTAVINRDIRALPSGSNIEDFAQDCAAIMTGVLMMLKSDSTIHSTDQALCFLLSEETEKCDAASNWIAKADGDKVRERLSKLPGFAFVFLAASPNDSAASFMARDAFWAAMLGGT